MFFCREVTMSFFLIFIVIIILFFAYTIKQEKKRTEALKNLADSIGFTFNPKPMAEDYSISTFQLFDIGHSKRFSNGMTQEKNGVKISMFDRCITGASHVISTFL